MSSTAADDPAARRQIRPDDALRRDVRLVGDALGRVLVEQVGEDLLADVELVITAHPTEAARRTVLQAQLQLSRILQALDDPALAPAARRRLEDEVVAEITALWQADEVRSRRPRVVDEIRHALWFFETTLLDVAPDVLADYRERLPGAPAPLRFGSWVGGDQDGNPEAGPDTIPEWPRPA